MIDSTYKQDLYDAPTFDLPSEEEAHAVARRHAASRPVVDLCRCGTEEGLKRAVVAAGLPNAATRFARRASTAVGPNSLAQIAGDFVRLERSM